MKALLGTQLFSLKDLDYDSEASAEEQVEERVVQMFAKALHSGRLIAFVGSGLSIPRGYPSWADLPTVIADEATAAAAESDTNCYYQYLRARDDPKLDARTRQEMPSVMSALDECHERLERSRTSQGTSLLHGIVSEKFRELARVATKMPRAKALDALIKSLGIRRFMTTNYDREVEEALEAHYGSTPKSLSLSKEDAPELPLFALGVPRYDAGVFHCHGVYDQPADMVITTADYQRVYLNDEPHNDLYRRAMRIAFASNAIVFVGFSFTDGEPVRSLKYFATARQPGTPEPMLFALLEKPAKPWAAAELRRRLYREYGLKAIWYEADTGDQIDARLARRITKLGKEREDWWLSWQRKPLMRCWYDERAPRPRSLLLQDRELFADFGERENEKKKRSPIDEALDKHPDRGKFIVVYGRPGTGKGKLALDLARERGTRDGSSGYDFCFYATLRFRNEFRSVIDLVVEQFGHGCDLRELRRGNRQVPASTRWLALALETRRCLLVIDGFERLLITPTRAGEAWCREASEERPDDRERGYPATTEVTRLLESFCDLHEKPNVHSHVVVFTSIDPEFAPSEPGRDAVKRCQIIEAPALLREQVVEAFTSAPQLADTAPKLVERLYGLLSGHAACLSLCLRVAKWKREELGVDWDGTGWLQTLIVELSSTNGRRRPEHVIGYIDEHFVRAHENRAKILKHLALFATPVSEEVLRAAAGHAAGGQERERVPTSESPRHETASDRHQTGKGESRDEPLHQSLLALTKVGLLIRVKPPANSAKQVSQTAQDRSRYTCHSVVRAYLLKQIGNASYAPGEPHPLVATGLVRHPPSQTAFNFTSEALDRLLLQIENESVPDDIRRDLLRGAFSLIEGCLNAEGLSCLGEIQSLTDDGRAVAHYDAYQRRLMRIANALRNASDRGWSSDATCRDWEARFHRADAVDPQATLYPDELVWLYSELTAAAQMQGYLYDAYAFARQVEAITDLIERGEHGRGFCQTQIRLASISLDLGNLREAGHHLERARGAVGAQHRDLIPVIQGYWAVMRHIEGKYAEAAGGYDEAIRGFNKASDHRSASRFLCLRGDLRHRLNDRAGAGADLEESLIRAEMDRSADLVHYAQLLRIRLGYDVPDKLARDRILAAARNLGQPRLAAEVHRVWAQRSCEVGDLSRAVGEVDVALAAWPLLGMRLQQTQTLVLAGDIARMRGDKHAARVFLGAGRELARKEGYNPEAMRAQELLVLLDAPNE